MRKYGIMNINLNILSRFRLSTLYLFENVVLCKVLLAESNKQHSQNLTLQYIALVV